VLLEEVQRSAAIALAEGELVGTDVEHSGLGRGPKLVQEELELPPARAQRDSIDEAHRR
jgi:hypothetical protein